MKNFLRKFFLASFSTAFSLSLYQCPQACAQQAVYATGQTYPPTMINAYQTWPTNYPAPYPNTMPYQQAYPPQYNQAAPYPQAPIQEAEIEKEDRRVKAKEPALSPYEQQELALKQSREEYGAPEKMPSPDYNHLDLESQYNQAPATRGVKLKNAMRNAGKIIGATAAVAIPVTSIVLMSRQAARSTGGSMFNRISGF
jgi:hypothetical protein